MRERYIRKYKQEVNESSVYCKEKFYHQLVQKGHDDMSAQIGAMIMFNINGINSGISV